MSDKIMGVRRCDVCGGPISSKNALDHLHIDYLPQRDYLPQSKEPKFVCCKCGKIIPEGEEFIFMIDSDEVYCMRCEGKI